MNPADLLHPPLQPAQSVGLESTLLVDRTTYKTVKLADVRAALTNFLQSPQASMGFGDV